MIKIGQFLKKELKQFAKNTIGKERDKTIKKIKSFIIKRERDIRKKNKKGIITLLLWL